MADLEPCPFCGGEAEIRGSILLFVQCTKCRTRYGDSYHANKAVAIAAWNTRAERTCHYVCDNLEWDMPTCSECGSEWVEAYNYCPDCGAKVVNE